MEDALLQVVAPSDEGFNPTDDEEIEVSSAEADDDDDDGNYNKVEE